MAAAKIANGFLSAASAAGDGRSKDLYSLCLKEEIDIS